MQYVGTWQFAENQWEFFGVSQSDDHRDLFSWGTGDAPNKVGKDYNDYSTFTDWGANVISNGGNKANLWRTLTKDEWGYLFCGRKNASTLFGLGNVNGINGTILLPDNWTLPSGSSFTACTTHGMVRIDDYYYYEDDESKHFADNTYTAEQWKTMENNGAVFLPATGSVLGTDVLSAGWRGGYWSVTPYDEDLAYGFFFHSSVLGPQGSSYRSRGFSVRLVK